MTFLLIMTPAEAILIGGFAVKEYRPIKLITF